jgi:hypothetical protein
VNNKGELVVKTPVGEMIEEKPYCFQKIGGKEVEVEAGYEVMGGGQYRFRVGEYDGRYDLVIDPELVYSTYLGGADGQDIAWDIAVDDDGCAYVTGKGIRDFPVTGSLADSTDAGVFVTKINPEGTALVYSAVFMGSYPYQNPSITIDDDGNAYIIGQCYGTEFPMTPNTFDTKPLSMKSFITKLNPQGNELIYSTALGGTDGSMNISGITINQTGEA